jgi:small subunit ribosomal protein S9
METQTETETETQTETETETQTETEPEVRQGTTLGTGRRKGAIARVRLSPGTGKFELNGRFLEDYFPSRAHRMEITEPLRLAERDKDLDVFARLGGGGVSGQAGALRHGLARALIELDPSYRPLLKKEGLLTRDPREKERRKYGLKKARKAPQYSKR